MEPPDPALRGNCCSLRATRASAISPRRGTGSAGSGGSIILFLLYDDTLVAAILSNLQDLSELDQFSRDERTLKALKVLIIKTRSTALKVVTYGKPESPVHKELEQIFKLLYITLKEEKSTLKNWPFSARQRSLNITKAFENTLESVAQLLTEISIPMCLTFTESPVLESPEEPLPKRLLLEEEYITSQEENGGTDTSSKKTSSSTIFTDGLNTMKCSKSVIVTPTGSP